MRGLCGVIALVLCGLAVGMSDADAATCSAAQKRKNVAALKKFQRAIPKQRKAYFRTHKSPKARRAFVRRQQARLRALRKKAACRVPVRKPAPKLPAPAPDLVVSISAAGGSRIHEPIAYTVVVENRGSAAADGAALTSSLPSRLQRVDAAGCEGIWTITCALGQIPPSRSVTRTITARPTETGAVTLIASAAISGDREPSNNSAGVTRDVQALPTYPTPATTGFAFQLSRPAWADSAPSPATGEWPKTPGLFHPGVGPLRGGVLFVDFPDHPAGGSALSAGETAALLSSAAVPWYTEASYGRLNLTFEAIPGWHRMSKPVAEYGVAQCCDYAKLRAFVEEAVGLANPSTDFSRFDALWVVGPTTASDHLRILIDQRWAGQGITADGRELRRWISMPAAYPSIIPTQIEPARFSHWVATHEIGHFLGLPDVYLKPPGCPACPNSFDPVGYWDLLSDVPLHAHFLAWHKWLLGWLDPAQLRTVQPGDPPLEAELAPLAAPGGLKAVVSPLSPSLAYVVEAREPMGWEFGLCDRGVLVYTVDSTKGNAQAPVDLKPASSAVSPSCGPKSAAPYDVGPGEVSVFEDASAGFRVEVLGRLDDGRFRVRVTRS